MSDELTVIFFIFVSSRCLFKMRIIIVPEILDDIRIRILWI